MSNSLRWGSRSIVIDNHYLLVDDHVAGDDLGVVLVLELYTCLPHYVVLLPPFHVVKTQK